MLMKNRYYSIELIVSVLFVIMMFLFVHFIITPIENQTTQYKVVNIEKLPESTVALEYDYADSNVSYSTGITEFLHNIEVEPIYQETEGESIKEETVDPITYEFELTGYVNVNTELNVRQAPDKTSDIISKLNWMDEIKYSIVNDEWACIQLGDQSYGYIASKYITDTYESYTKTYDISGDKAKTYMDYRTITDKKSTQYKLQLRASTNVENGLRMLRNRYMVAVGSYFNCKVGQYIDVVLADGEVLPCIIGDAKQDIHTDNQNLHGLSGDTVEFIVNETVLKNTTDVVGNISDVSEVFDDKVVEIRKYDHIEN